MGLWNRSSLPAFLNPKGRRGDPAERAAVQQALNGDVTTFKLNHVMVAYETVRDIDRCLKSSAHGIDYVKMTSGVYEERRSDVDGFVQTCKKHNVIPYIGGRITEDAIDDGRVYGLTQDLHGYGIDTVEVSNSSGELPASACEKTIKKLRKDFQKLIVEIGAKSTSRYQSLEQWKSDLDVALEADADTIILEGTGGGCAGIYDRDGDGNSALVLAMQERAGDKADRLLVEAPHIEQCRYWVNEVLGWNARLGNLHMNKASLAKVDRLRVEAMQPEGMKKVAENSRLQKALLAEYRKVAKEEKVDADTAIFLSGIHGVTHDVLQREDWREQFRDYLKRMSSASSPHFLSHEGALVIDMSEAMYLLMQALRDQRR